MRLVLDECCVIVSTRVTPTDDTVDVAVLGWMIVRVLLSTLVVDLAIENVPVDHVVEVIVMVSVLASVSVMVENSVWLDVNVVDEVTVVSTLSVTSNVVDIEAIDVTVS